MHRINKPSQQRARQRPLSSRPVSNMVSPQNHQLQGSLQTQPAIMHHMGPESLNLNNAKQIVSYYTQKPWAQNEQPLGSHLKDNGALRQSMSTKRHRRKPSVEKRRKANKRQTSISQTKGNFSTDGGRHSHSSQLVDNGSALYPATPSYYEVTNVGNSNYQRAPAQQSHPYHAINNNITLNVNLNVTTADNADQQKQLAEQIVQVANQNLQQANATTRQSPFVHPKLMTSPMNDSTAVVPKNPQKQNQKQSSQNAATYPNHRRNGSKGRVEPGNTATQAQQSNSKRPSLHVSQHSSFNQQQVKPQRPISAVKRGQGQSALSLQPVSNKPQSSLVPPLTQNTSTKSLEGLFIEGVRKESSKHPAQQVYNRQQIQNSNFNPDLAYVLDAADHSQQQENRNVAKSITDLFVDQNSRQKEDVVRSSTQLGPHQSLLSSSNKNLIVRNSQTFHQSGVVAPNQMSTQYLEDNRQKQLMGQQPPQVKQKSALSGLIQHSSRPLDGQRQHTTMTPKRQAQLQQSLIRSSNIQSDANEEQIVSFGILIPSQQQSQAKVPQNQANFKGFTHAGKPVQIKYQEGGKQPQALQQQDKSEGSRYIETIQSATRLQEHFGAAQENYQVGGVKPISDFHKMMLGEQHMQQVRSSEAYSHQRSSRPQQSALQQSVTTLKNVSGSGNGTGFNRPGRKVIQRPPSAKQRLSKERQQQKAQLMKSQSITLRQRQPATIQQLTPQQQHLQAVRNQRESVMHFLDKKSNEYKKPAAANPNHQLQKNSYRQSVGSFREQFAGMIQTTTDLGGDNSQSTGVGNRGTMPVFIKKTPAGSNANCSTLLTSEQHKPNFGLVATGRGLQVNENKGKHDLNVISSKTLPDLNAYEKVLMSMGQKAIQDYMLIKDAVPQKTQKLIQENMKIMTQIHQDSIASLVVQSPETGVTGAKLIVQAASSNQRKSLAASASFKNVHQSVNNMTQPIRISNRRQSNQVRTNNETMLASRAVTMQHEEYTPMNIISPKNGQGAPVQATSRPLSTQNRRKQSRPNRPKSGIPLNRAPFRPSGVAQPSELVSPSKRNLNSGLRQNGMLGRTGQFSDKDVSLSRDDAGKPKSRTGVSNFNQNKKDDAKNSEDGDSYGDSYYDEEGSYDSENAADDKETLVYDDGQEYSPVKEPTYPESLTKAQPQTSPLNKPQKGSSLAIKSIDGKRNESQKVTKFDNFGTPLKSPLLVGDKKAENVTKDLNESHSEELSDGYLDNDDAYMCEEEEEVIFKAKNNLKNLSPKPQSNLTISSSKSPKPVHQKKTIKLKVAEAAPVTLSQELKTLQSEQKKKNAINAGGTLGVSSSAKVIQNQNSYMDGSSPSKKSIQLSDSCPKENLVRQLYQRPGGMKQFEGVNARLRSISVKQKQSAAQSAYPGAVIGPSQPSKAITVKSPDDAFQQLLAEMKENIRKKENFNAEDPYTQSQPVYLVKSPFMGRPPSIFFQYPPGVSDIQKPVDKEHIFKMKQNKFKIRFKVSEGVHTYNCVVNSLCWAGFQQTDCSNWNVMWSAPLKPETLRNYDMFKHNNHFPGTWQLGRKDLMYRNVFSQIREHGAEYEIVPKTWILPYDLRIFQKEREETAGKMLWILKPAAAACGRGIKILNKHSSLPKKGAYVINQYIMKPHLLRGFKYDLRLYVLVTCFEPLTIYIYQDGLVRFATQPYTTKNRKSKFAHLTNFSVNKKAKNYKKAGMKDQSEENSSKWRLQTLINAFKREGHDWDEVWGKIHDLVIKAIISVEPILANNLNRASRNRHLCFEVFGFDVIIDQNMRPWLLEVNVLPSLSSSSGLDKRIKTSMMTDTFSTIGIVPYNKKKFERMQDNSRWNRFSGIKNAGTKDKKVSNIPVDQERYFDEKQDRENDHREFRSGGLTDNYATGEEIGSSSEEEENTAWTQTQVNMAQSQSNYIQSKIRSAKDVQAVTNLNIEEQLVIVELCEEYGRRGKFDLIFPRKSTVEKYKKYFRVPRACNSIVWKWLKLNSVQTTIASSSAKVGSSSKETKKGDSNKEAKTRFSVLKDFQIRKNCHSRYIEAIKEI